MRKPSLGETGLRGRLLEAVLLASRTSRLYLRKHLRVTRHVGKFTGASLVRATGQEGAPSPPGEGSSHTPGPLNGPSTVKQ